VTHKLIDLDKRASIEQHLDALTCCLFALSVLFLDSSFPSGVDCFVVAVLEVLELAGGGTQIWFIAHDLLTSPPTLLGK
jgi:hypothetical protein